jgi:hypothetical protein
MAISSVSGSSGTIDLSEMRKKMADRMADRMMKDLDTDGDGALSKGDLAKAQEAASGSKNSTISESSLDDLFKALDSDSDGSISKDELSTFMEKAGPPAPPSGQGPKGPPPMGPPPDGASMDSAKATEAFDETSQKDRMAYAYQQLMSLLQNLST